MAVRTKNAKVSVAQNNKCVFPAHATFTPWVAGGRGGGGRVLFSL